MNKLPCRILAPEDIKKILDFPMPKGNQAIYDFDRKASKADAMVTVKRLREHYCCELFQYFGQLSILISVRDDRDQLEQQK